MSKYKRIGKKELNDLKRIEALLESTKKKEVLVEKVKQIQEVHKEESEAIQCLPYQHKQVKITELGVSQHAHERAIERFGLKRTTQKEVSDFLLKHLLSSKYIGQIICSDGNEGHMFVKGQIVYQLNLELTNIITVIKVEHKIRNNPFNCKIENLLFKEFRKLDRKEHATLKRLNEFVYDAKVEIAECERRIHRTKSLPVRLSCKGRIAALKQEHETLISEIEMIRTDKRNTAYSIAEII